MARPPPQPEDTKVRTTVSLPIKLIEAADAYRAAHPTEDLRDFSAIISRALIDYFERRQPGLLADVIAQIRKKTENFPDVESATLAVAEEAAVGELQRRRKKAKARAGGVEAKR